MLKTAAIFFGLSQISLLGCLFIRHQNRRLPEWLLILLLLCVAADMLLQLMPVDTPLVVYRAIQFVQTAIPGLFWLWCVSVFEDHFRLRHWHIILVVMLSVLPLGNSMYQTLPNPGYAATTNLLFKELPQLVELILVSHGLSMVIRNWHGDLVPLRRQIRPQLVVFAGLLIFTVITTRYVIKINPLWLIDAQYVLLALFLLFFNMQVLRWQSLQLLGAPNDELVEDELDSRDESAQLDEVDKKLVAQLHSLMSDQLLYRKNGLTIKQVADQLHLPEYRLRLLINRELGYRNFNDFIGRYRIEEAATRLANPQEKHLPVLTIALDSGYRSLSTFNKSFKITHGITPTEYRRKHGI